MGWEPLSVEGSTTVGALEHIWSLWCSHGVAAVGVQAVDVALLRVVGLIDI